AVVIAGSGCGRFDFDEVVVPGGPLVVEPTYAELPAWNDYVEEERASEPSYRQPGSPCTTRCIHAGEHRKVALGGLASCVGVTASDALGALEWLCDDTSGQAIVYATGLREDRGLRDLVDASGWKPNRVQVTFRTGDVRTSDAAVWWSNPVAPLPNNPAGPP